jgi:hypothetical protein
LPKQGKWPCYFSPSDTTGEKDFEEFFTNGEMLDLERFQHIGIVKSKIDFNENILEMFLDRVKEMKNSGKWKREEILNLFQSILPEFIHLEKGKFLDSKM